MSTNPYFPASMVRSNIAWAGSTLAHVVVKNGLTYTKVQELLSKARTAPEAEIHQIYQYLSPLFDMLVRYARSEEGCHYSRAYVAKLEAALVQVKRVADHLESEATASTMDRLLSMCRA